LCGKRRVKEGGADICLVPSNPWSYLLDRSILLRIASDDGATRKAKTIEEKSSSDAIISNLEITAMVGLPTYQSSAYGEE